MVRTSLLLLALAAPIFAIVVRPIPTRAAETRIARGVIQWEVSPGSVVVYLDRERLGAASDLTSTRTAPGRHTIRLVNGEDETELEVEVAKGQVLKFVFDFSE